ncbi:SDR family NAD(P)-dependent oxidoreductase [Oricola indica]|uniref:SDR family NAD(P)-dependent oxidoreductase n=1 Tax=Oricola indica TaxID=2872591 RepID=UPI003CCB8972
MTATGKALVTGGNAGLGRAFCAALCDEGYAVTTLDQTAPDGFVPWTHRMCDLSDHAKLDAAIVNLAAVGPFDIVVLNAGISATGRFQAIPLDAHLKLLSVNTEAPLVLCAGLAARGALAPGGRVIFVSSLSHWTGYPGAASYAASKDAIAAYAKSIRKPFRKAFGVRVSCAFPGPLRTRHAARHAPKGASAAHRMEPDLAAGLILKSAKRGFATILPGNRAKMAALAGWLLPRAVTRFMGRTVFRKLDREVW